MKQLTRHLDSVNETYFQHARHAMSFALHLFAGALVCMIHAVFPFLFERTGSDIIGRLHDRMVVNRRRLTPGSKASLGVGRDAVVAKR